MRAFLELGDAGQAIREFERFRRVFESDFGIPPSEQTRSLHHAIRMRAQLKPPSPVGRLSTLHLQHTDMAPAEAGATPPSPGRRSNMVEPSIAVLPFQSLSAEREHDHVAQGLADDLVETLSRVPGMAA